MSTFKAIISYDGTRYLGWQKTKEGPSIQETLQNALFRITGEVGEIEAASRTDRGVHAEGQTIRFISNKKNVHFLRALNALLPPDIRVLHVEEKTFHPTLDARKKEYRYRLNCNPVQEPIHRLYAWHIRYPLELAKMEKAALQLIGTFDFSAFANEEETDPLCTLEKIELSPLDEGQLQIAIVGNRFLYKMMRNLVGTLVYIGCGKLPEDSILKILSSRDRKQAGITAPAHGLYLHKVFYE